MGHALRGAGALALAFALGCGGETEPAPQQRSMAQPKRVEHVDEAANQPPMIDRVEIVPDAPSPAVPIEANVRANDPDGDRITYEYTWKANGRPIGSEETLPAGAVSRDDRLELEVVASDGVAESAPATATATVAAAPPQIREITFEPIAPKPGDVVSALVDAGSEDEERLALSYQWLVNGRQAGEDAKTFPTADLRRGDKLQVRVIARDGDLASPATTSSYVEIGNTPPRIKGIPTPQKDGDAFKYAFEAEDADGDRSLRYSLSTAPAGMTIDPIDGVATWRPTQEQAGDQTVEVTVKDSAGGASSLRFTVAVNVAPPETVPAEAAKAAEAPPAKREELRLSDQPDASEAADEPYEPGDPGEQD
jgi:hypothetical protein